MLRIFISDLASHVRPFRFLVAAIAIRRIYPLAALVTFIGFAGQAHAQTAPACEPEMARLTSVQGTVEIRPNEGVAWRPAELNDILCIGATIRVSTFSRAALAFTDDSTLRLDQDTTLTIREREEERRTWLEMLTGAIHFFSHRPRSLKVDTPFVNAAAEGTEFLIRINGAEAHILMYEGVVLASNEAGQLRLGPDDAALIRAGEKPIPEIVVRPRDAVAWAVHYPPVLSLLADVGEPGVYPQEVKNALEWLGDNNYRYALRSLDKIPENERDARNEALRAGILLNIGRVEEAEAAIERALAIDAEAADAYALRTILHVTRNDRAQASRDADRAVTLAPNSSTALIAQSYARQASYDLEGARESLRNAVAKNPNDALAFARLSEIELSFADYDRASDAAAEAIRLAPALARTQTVRGFSALAEIDTGAARTAFARSIELNSAAPLPHLGQGLAKIRDGNLEAGRRDLEIAASLDPNNALIRSYLGKAYFEEKRGPNDATQFDIAKKLDPNDPTPWFYDAIRKQTENRPVEALRDLEKAIELNDNRAVYRSRLLLDGDFAARGTSVARIYDDLGFDQVAVVEAARSLKRSPANWSAHRFLSDAYARLPRHEIARASELLQAQLLQPININPVQPSLPFIDLSIIDSIGPAESAFSEFHSLFERNRTRVTASGQVGDGKGNRNSVGDEIVASGLFDSLSFSLGQFHSETDGFRSNNDLSTDIYNAFAQWSVSPRLNIQAEYRHREIDQGDLEFNFDPNFFFNDRREIGDDVGRLGIHFSPNSGSTFLLSAIYAELADRIIETDTFPDAEGAISTFVIDSEQEDKAYQIEFQHLLDRKYFDIIWGLGTLHSDVQSDDINTLNGQVTDTFSSEFDRDQDNAYIYGNIALPKEALLTVGMGFTSLEQRSLNIDELEPKFGIEWPVTDRLRLRAARFKAVKRPLVIDQTIEPTQIAGFNQFFDGRNGEKSTRYGLGADIKLSESMYTGLEISRRDLRAPIGFQGSILFEDRQEDEIRGYFYWMPAQNWSVTLDASYEKFTSENSVNSNLPEDISTFSLPLGIRHFFNSGFFAALQATYLRQDLERGDNAFFPDGDDEAIFFDAAVGYRMPNRSGILSFEVENIFDKRFSYQDDTFRAPSQSLGIPQFIPERRLMARATLNF